MHNTTCLNEGELRTLIDKTREGIYKAGASTIKDLGGFALYQDGNFIVAKYLESSGTHVEGQALGWLKAVYFPKGAVGDFVVRLYTEREPCPTCIKDLFENGTFVSDLQNLAGKGSSITLEVLTRKGYNPWRPWIPWP